MCQHFLVHQKRTECRRRRCQDRFAPTARRILCVHAVYCRIYFLLTTQVEAFTSAGFLHRKGLQYHWRNRDRKIDGSSVSNENTNTNNSSKNKTNNGNSINNNGADIPTATMTTIPVGATTPASPSEAAEQAPTTAAGEGNEGANKKYADFDSYLRNFASKRRIKVLCFCETRSYFCEMRRSSVHRFFFFFLLLSA